MLRVQDSVMETCYEGILKRYLTREPSFSVRQYFVQQSWRCWTGNFAEEDYKKIKSLEQLFLALHKSNPQLLIDMGELIFANTHHKRQLLEQWSSEWIVAQKDEENRIVFFTKGFAYYKNLFESEFFLWATPLAAHIAEHLNPKQKSQILPASPATITAADYYNASSSAKIKVINSSPDTSVYVNRIDTQFRNAGAWHDKWKVLDNWNCRYEVVDPKTLQVKSVVEISPEDFKTKITAAEKDLLILELWFQIFVNNHVSHIFSTWSNPTPLDISEIQRYAPLYAEQYQLEVTKCNLPLDRSLLTLELNHEKELKSSHHSVYVDGGYRCDIVRKRKSARFIDSALSIVRRIIELNWTNLFNLDLKITDGETGEVFHGIFEQTEVAKILASTLDNKIYPSPKEGKLPEDVYELYLDQSVPYGSGADVQKILDCPVIMEDYKNAYLAFHKDLLRGKRG